jgi:hypothetical protein
VSADTEAFEFGFAKDPVTAVRLPWVFDLRSVEGATLRPPKEFDHPWLVVNADGSMHMLQDKVFRRLYKPLNDGSRRYLESRATVEDATAGDPESDRPIRTITEAP